MSELPLWTFGEAPLPEHLEFAAAVREVTGKVLALEHASDDVRRLTAALAEVSARLDALLPADLRPRIGATPGDDQRVYIDHSRDIGDYNPFFPPYELRCADDRAEGTVEFPLAYEGPPGSVHGGFLAVLFDCVLQQLSCDMGIAGKTATLSVRYRRPTPLRTPLRIEATRELAEGRIRSRAQLFHDGELLCEAEMTAAIGSRDALPAVSPRREP
jgi:acyl-coenzyme A thioesterase PaaI-like protein